MDIETEKADIQSVKSGHWELKVDIQSVKLRITSFENMQKLRIWHLLNGHCENKKVQRLVAQLHRVLTPFTIPPNTN